MLSADSLLICCFGQAFPSPHLNRSLFTTPFPSSRDGAGNDERVLRERVCVGWWGDAELESWFFSLFQINTACIPAQPSELVRLPFSCCIFPQCISAFVIFVLTSYIYTSRISLPLIGSLIDYFLVHLLINLCTFSLSFSFTLPFSHYLVVKNDIICIFYVWKSCKALIKTFITLLVHYYICETMIHFL